MWLWIIRIMEIGPHLFCGLLFFIEHDIRLAVLQCEIYIIWKVYKDRVLDNVTKVTRDTMFCNKHGYSLIILKRWVEWTRWPTRELRNFCLNWTSEEVLSVSHSQPHRHMRLKLYWYGCRVILYNNFYLCHPASKTARATLHLCSFSFLPSWQC